MSQEPQGLQAHQPPIERGQVPPVLRMVLKVASQQPVWGLLEKEEEPRQQVPTE